MTTANMTGCRVRRSTGDADYDAIGCAAILACTPPVSRAMTAWQAEHPRARRREMQAYLETLMPALSACYRTEHTNGLQRLGDRRAGIVAL